MECVQPVIYNDFDEYHECLLDSFGMDFDEYHVCLLDSLDSGQYCHKWLLDSPDIDQKLAAKVSEEGVGLDVDVGLDIHDEVDPHDYDRGSELVERHSVAQHSAARIDGNDNADAAGRDRADVLELAGHCNVECATDNTVPECRWEALPNWQEQEVAFPSNTGKGKPRI